MTSTRAVRSPRIPLALAIVAVCLGAVLPYVSTLHNYFVQDDFGVVQLLARKPASSFFGWFTTTWMDDIWGYIPDEIRPFPAVTYQLTALWGAASPTANHVLNIALHAANGLLVLALARMAAGLVLPAATFAALVFVLLPNQAESVAWITGRVDTLPALFYVASLLAYVSWRRQHGQAPTRYALAVGLFFIALFCKQNTITLVPALVAYDYLIARRPVRASWDWMRPYVPFTILTAGYLGLRYVVFGEIARESQLTAEGMTFFGHLVTRHMSRLVFGDVAAGTPLLWTIVAAATVALGLVARRIGRGAEAARTFLYFGPVWLFLGIAPVIVANYESPRHVYLASFGWAILLGLALHVLWCAREGSADAMTTTGEMTAGETMTAAAAETRTMPTGGTGAMPTSGTRAIPTSGSRPLYGQLWRGAGCVLAIALLFAYGARLSAVVGQWHAAAALSRQAVNDLERVTRGAPKGTLVIAGVPPGSWEWSLPFAARPPFTHADVAREVLLVSPWRLHCCRSRWDDDTRRALTAWVERVPHAPLIALHWDERTGVFSMVMDEQDPFLRQMPRLLLDARTPEALDERMLDFLTRAVAGRGASTRR